MLNVKVNKSVLFIQIHWHAKQVGGTKIQRGSRSFEKAIKFYANE